LGNPKRDVASGEQVGKIFDRLSRRGG